MPSVGCELGCLLGGGVCFAGVKHLLEKTGTRRAPPVGPLAGVKVLDIAQVVSAPYGVRLLADLGAEVIKVESLDHPDSCRGLGPTPVRGMPSMWMFVNQMKRSIVLDLKDPKGVEIFKELAKDADVIVQNFRPGAVDRMGIGYEAIKAVNPDIIYVSVSGFGQEGPLSDRRVYDPVVQCMSGFCVASADENGNRLTPCFLVDKFTSFTVFQACLAALLARSLGHGGQKIEISMLEMMVQLLWPDTYSNKTPGGVWGPILSGFWPTNVWNVECGGSNPTPIRFYHFWDTKDSHSKLCIKMDTDEEWCKFCAAIGKPEWKSDERFSTVASRDVNMAEWVEDVQTVLLERSLADTQTVLTAGGVQHAVSLNEQEALQSMFAKESGTAAEQKTLLFGTARMPKFPVAFSRTPACHPWGRPAAMLGEHTSQIMREIGYDPQKHPMAISTKSFLLQRPETAKKAKVFGIQETLQKASLRNFWKAKAPKSRQPAVATPPAASAPGGPLAGVRVLELSESLGGGFAGMLLSDQGAEVVKLELAGRPDPARSWGAAPAKGMSSAHMVLNRGKKSVMLDDSSQEVGKLVAKLADTADAIIIDAPSLVAKNLGLDPGVLTRNYPDKVIVDITAFSCNCKMKDELADDMILQAITGLAFSLMNINGDPVCANTMIFEKVTGFLASGAILAGLYSKLQCGSGQRANVSKYDAAMHFNWSDGFMNSTWKDTIKPGEGRVQKFPPLSAVYKLSYSSDRKACMTVVALGDAEFKGFLEATDSQDILTEKPHWKTLPGRLADMTELMAFAQEATKKVGRDELDRRCQENGVPCALVLTIEELMQHPQALASEIFQSCSHPELGAYVLPRHAARFIGTPATSAGQPAPLPGQHSSEVLLGAGLSDEEVAAHVASGAVQGAGPIERLEVHWMSGAALWGRARMKVAPVVAFRDFAKKQKRGFNKSSSESFDQTIQQLIRQESGAMMQCL